MERRKPAIKKPVLKLQQPPKRPPRDGLINRYKLKLDAAIPSTLDEADGFVVKRQFEILGLVPGSRIELPLWLPITQRLFVSKANPRDAQRVVHTRNVVQLEDIVSKGGVIYLTWIMNSDIGPRNTRVPTRCRYDEWVRCGGRVVKD